MRRDAPKPPNSVIDFNITKFDKLFKTYWENMYYKAKQIRKKNI